MRLLVVEDDPVMRLTAATLARSIGFSTHVAEGRKLVLGLLRTVAFDVVLLDLDQLWLDSAEALEVIRKGGGPNAGALVIGASSEAGRNPREPKSASSLDGLVLKPYDQNDLLEEIVRVLEIGRESATAMNRPLWSCAGRAVRDDARQGAQDAVGIVLEELDGDSDS